jgi:hypothetical protein
MSVAHNTQVKFSHVNTVDDEYPSGIWDTTNKDTQLPCGMYAALGSFQLPLGGVTTALLQLSFGTSTSNLFGVNTVGYPSTVATGDIQVRVTDPSQNWTFYAYHTIGSSTTTSTADNNNFIKIMRVG